MRPYLFGTAVAAAWLTASRLHRLQSCDSLVFSLASLYEWDPFFWEQDRVGLLLPLLVSPVRDPFANLLALTGLMSLAGLLVPLLLARLVCPHPAAYAAATLGNAVLVAFGPDVLHENLFVACNYPLALCFGLPALKLLDRPTAGRWVLALGLLLLAHWVYLGVAVFLAALAAARWLVRPRWASWWAGARVALALGVSVAVMAVLSAEWRVLHPEIDETPSSGLPAVDWPRNWLAFFDSLATFDGVTTWSLAVLAAAGGGLLASVLAGRRLWPVALLALPLVPAAAIELLLLGTRAWPAMNQHHPRYLLAGLSAVWVALLATAWVPVFRLRPAAAGVTAFALLSAAIGVRYGPPSLAAARFELDDNLGRDTADYLSAQADAVSGEYMATWPNVWHVNLVAHERGEGRVIAGVSARSAPWAWRWRTGPLKGGFRLAGPFDQEPQVRRWVRHHGLRVTGGPTRHGRLIVFTVEPAD
jgi:hypothetical protein